ncbi:MAG TPA: signal recognition particle subunit SRP19/SEC65 family protein [Nitrososphaerales archaeon]|nr:signal recognition particle subunit SRP19/SEC65 family protein [Nitrososphaerales archaeon]
MKEYERQVIWLDYFNSELKRREGRRVPMHSATRSPTLEELGEACKRLKIESVTQPAQFPLSPTRQSGFVSVPKSKPKQGLVMTIAKELSVVRGLAQKKQQPQQQRKQQGRTH